MPLPLILGIGAAIAGAAGLGSGIHGGIKMKEAKDTMSSADSRHKKNIARFEKQSTDTNTAMDELGKIELEILKSFEKFSGIFEKIKNRPQFKEFDTEGVHIPEYDAEKLKEVSVGAGLLLAGLGGAALGTAGGFAAAGATTAAVMALGTASTGTAIASLTGAAATNAALAALGGGALGIGGGMALGTTILSATTLGVGLLVGGIVFNITGSSLSNKADEAWDQMMRAEEEINKICSYLNDLSETAEKYKKALLSVNKVYQRYLEKLWTLVEIYGKTDWNMFDASEKSLTENTLLSVSLLFEMCKVQLVLKSDNEQDLNTVNTDEVEKELNHSEEFLEKHSAFCA